MEDVFPNWESAFVCDRVLVCRTMSNVRDDASAPSIVDTYSHLLSLAAHEFRTPASVVGGYLRMLQKDTESPLSERQQKMVDEAVNPCTGIGGIVAELSENAKL